MCKLLQAIYCNTLSNWENWVMRRMLVIFGVTLATLAVPAVQAQVTIDVSKITCNQMFAYKIADPNKIALWLSGYYNGKRGTTIVDTQQFQLMRASWKITAFIIPRCQLCRQLVNCSAQENRQSQVDQAPPSPHARAN
jgi:hypothetical protein